MQDEGRDANQRQDCPYVHLLEHVGVLRGCRARRRGEALGSSERFVNLRVLDRAREADVDQCRRSPRGADQLHERVDGLSVGSDRVVVSRRIARRGVMEDQRLHAVRVGCRVEDCHRARIERSKNRGLGRPHSIEHRAHVLGPFLPRGDGAARYGIGDARATTVESAAAPRDQSCPSEGFGARAMATSGHRLPAVPYLVSGSYDAGR